MIWRNIIKLQITCYLVVLSSVSAQDNCQTPRNKQGGCVVISDCKELNDILQNRFRTPEETRYLRASQCGQQGREPKVCCEGRGATSAGCLTPENDPGQCVNIYKCQPLADLLKLPKPLPQSAVSYLRSVACQGAERYSVCCSGKRPSLGGNIQKVDPNTLLPTVCGEEADTDRIVGGEVTEINQYPWMALIEYRKGASTRLSQSCAASLISKRYLVTAAHCVAGAVLTVVGNPVNVRLGEFDKSNAGADCEPIIGGQACTDEPVVIPIEKYIAHPDFETAGVGPKNDIAVIRMASEAPYTDFIRPICLPATDKTLEPNASKLKLTVAGWGTTETGRASNKKLHLKTPFVDLQTCQNAYAEAGSTATLWEKQLCAGGVKGKDSCRGDSGGPLMNSIQSKYNLIGVVSYGPTPCGKEGVPGVYSKVYAYLDWIKNQLEP